VAPSEGLVADLAAAILDGSPIDWTSAETSADEEGRLLLDQLRLLAAVVDLHRSPTAPCMTPGSPANTASSHVDDEVLGQWGHLRVIERIGRGAFGDVYRAWDPRLDREVALKLLSAKSTNDDPRVLSIIEEGRLLARVHHPNVVTIYGADRIGDHIGLWMELIEGRTLQQSIEQRKTLTVGEAVEIGIELCRAVAAVHAAGLLHRDIKPHNVMQAENGRVVLMDFGTGREVGDASATALAGTPLYLAPELLSGEAATVRSDIYGLGVLLYHLITGSYPVRARSLAGLRLAHESCAKPDVRSVRPEIPAKLARVIERAIHPQPERRHPSADALAGDLLAVSRRPGIVALASLMAGAAGLTAAAWIGWGGLARPATPAFEADAGVRPPRSIAVLPFKPIVAAEANEPLQLGMTEAVIDQLSRVKGLQVEPLARIRRFGALDNDPIEAGRSLGVEAVLEGSFRQTPTGIHVRSRLLRTRDGASLATNEWHDPFASILEVQRHLAESLADAIALTLTPAERAGFRDQDTSNPEAYRHYLFGRYHLEYRSVERMLEAEREFREALRLDPRYARAHAGLSIALTHLAWLVGRRGSDVMGPAKAAALQAVAIDDSVALAHTALAYVFETFEYDQLGAQDEHLRALARDDQDLWVLRAYASFLMRSNAFDEALDVHRRVLALEPTSPLSHRHHAMTLYTARRYEECVTASRRALMLDPADRSISYAWLGLCLEELGRRREAVEAWEKERAAWGEADLAERMMRTYAAHGWEGYWRERLRLAAKPAPNQLPDIQPAIAHVRLGNVDEAVRTLERLVETRAPSILFSNQPQWDPLRSDPRFQALMVRIGHTPEVQTELARLRRLNAGIGP
jgi:serine/threonine-protein kinase